MFLPIQRHGPEQPALALQREMLRRPAGIFGYTAGLLCRDQEFVPQEREGIARKGIPIVPGDIGNGVVDG